MDGWFVRYIFIKEVKIKEGKEKFSHRQNRKFFNKLV